MERPEDIAELIAAIPSAFLGRMILRRIAQRGLVKADDEHGCRAVWVDHADQALGDELKELLASMLR